MKLKLAKACSTCLYAIFNKGNMRWGGKKQGGLCSFGCYPQEVPASPPHLHHIVKDAKTADDAYIRAYRFWCESMQADLGRAETRLSSGWEYEYWQAAQERLEDNPNYRYQVGNLYNPTWEECEAYLQGRIEEMKAEFGKEDSKAKKYSLRWQMDWQKKKDWDTWWNENYKHCHLIHRQTVCDSYEEGPKRRESWARGVVSGKHTLTK